MDKTFFYTSRWKTPTGFFFAPFLMIAYPCKPIVKRIPKKK
jgi:hypothetical protein